MSQNVPSANAARYAHIPGWGADLDPAMRPAYPMERSPPRLPHPPLGPPQQQLTQAEVLCSTEHRGITPLFGSSLPPSGLSGVLRRAAFRHSENDLRHWTLLLLADRIQVGEGLVQDLRQGHCPNRYREMGGPAELRHNGTGALKKLALLAGGLTVCVLLARRRR